MPFVLCRCARRSCMRGRHSGFSSSRLSSVDQCCHDSDSEAAVTRAQVPQQQLHSPPYSARSHSLHRPWHQNVCPAFSSAGSTLRHPGWSAAHALRLTCNAGTTRRSRLSTSRILLHRVFRFCQTLAEQVAQRCTGGRRHLTAHSWVSA